MIFTLPITDIEDIMRLVAAALNPYQTKSIDERKFALLMGIQEMIDADVFLYCSVHPCQSDPLASQFESIADSGWLDSKQRKKAILALASPELASLTVWRSPPDNARFANVTWRREDYIDDTTWQKTARKWLNAGLVHSIFSASRLLCSCVSNVSFHRSKSKPPFTELDRAIVQVTFGQWDWFHHTRGSHAAGQVAAGLTRRERQVLTCLLRGANRRDIAEELGLSQHTVGDYVKAIYSKYSVTTRSALQAKFRFDEPPP